MPHIGYAFGYTVNPIQQLLTVYKAGGNALQISISNPADFSRSEVVKNKDVYNATAAKYGIYTVVHGKFVYNLARPNPTKQLELIKYELGEAHSLNAALVLHQGKNVLHLEHINALNIYIDNINRLLDETQAGTILLENSAAQGTEIGYSLSDLSYIWDRIKKKDRCSYCLDSCHAFSAGEIDFRVKECVTSYMEEFDRKIGLLHLKLIHFNDSGCCFAGKNDYHAPLGQGFISFSDGMKELLSWAYKYNIPVILETGGPINSEISMLRHYCVSL